MISSDGEKLTQLEQALVAGNDLILYVDGTDKQEILEHAIKFMRDGGIGLIDLDQRVRRILEKKQKIIAMDDFIALEMME